MENLNQENIREVIDILRKISNNPWTMGSVLASFFVGLVALFKEEMKGFILKPRIIISPNIFNFEQKTLLISRMKIKNEKYLSKNTVFVAEKLEYKEKDESEWKKSKNFCSYSLRWTHKNNNGYLDLHRDRPYFMDLCEVITKDINGNKINPYIRMCSPDGVPFMHGLDDLKDGYNRMTIAIYSENLKRKEFKAIIFWNGGESFAEIKFEDLPN